MKITNFLECENEIALNNKEDALKIASCLLNQGYVVMLSSEEQLTIINYIWRSELGDRNDIVFMSRDTFEECFCSIADLEEDNL